MLVFHHGDFRDISDRGLGPEGPVALLGNGEKLLKDGELSSCGHPAPVGDEGIVLHIKLGLKQGGVGFGNGQGGVLPREAPVIQGAILEQGKGEA